MPDHHSLWTEGFKQVWRTARSINKHYPHGLRWFLLATVFAEAGTKTTVCSVIVKLLSAKFSQSLALFNTGANAFTSIAVIYLGDQLQMSSTEIGIVFLITLVATVPGALFGAAVTKRTNPNTSWKIDLLLFSIVTFTGAFALSGPELSSLAYVWGIMWGFILGYDIMSGIVPLCSRVCHLMFGTCLQQMVLLHCEPLFQFGAAKRPRGRAYRILCILHAGESRACNLWVFHKQITQHD